MLPTPVPLSPSELATPKVLFKGRLVSGKKSNSPFFVHQRHKSKTLLLQKEQSDLLNTSTLDKKLNQIKLDQLNQNKIQMMSTPSISSSSSSPAHSSILQSFRSLSFYGIQYSIIILIFSTFLSRMITEDWFWGYSGKYTRWSYYFPGPQEVFTIESLSNYDGIKDPTKPILLSINGIVYNVNSNLNMYGPNGAYHHFVGKDASRAFVTGCFKTGLTYDLRGLNDRQKKSLEYWANFFENSPKYERVGRLELPQLDDSIPLPKDCDPKAEGGAI